MAWHSTLLHAVLHRRIIENRIRAARLIAAEADVMRVQSDDSIAVS